MTYKSIEDKLTELEQRITELEAYKKLADKRFEWIALASDPITTEPPKPKPVKEVTFSEFLKKLLNETEK